MNDSGKEEVTYRISPAKANSSGRMVEEGRSGNEVASFCTGARKCGLCCAGVVVVMIFVAVLMADSIHTIEEGTVGIYFVQGALDERISQPGTN